MPRPLPPSRRPRPTPSSSRCSCCCTWRRRGTVLNIQTISRLLEMTTTKPRAAEFWAGSRARGRRRSGNVVDGSAREAPRALGSERKHDRDIPQVPVQDLFSTMRGKTRPSCLHHSPRRCPTRRGTVTSLQRELAGLPNLQNPDSPFFDQDWSGPASSIRTHPSHRKQIRTTLPLSSGRPVFQ